MAAKYIHELKDWPKFAWNEQYLAPQLEQVRLKQGKLIGKMESLGFNLKEEAMLKTLTEDVVKTSEIEGEKLDQLQVRSSIARRLGMNVAGLVKSYQEVDGIVEVKLDATQKYKEKLLIKRLFSWHAALFPLRSNSMGKMIVGHWRDDSEGPMQVISGPIGKAKIHFQAPAAKRIKKEIQKFLKWFNGKKVEDSILRSGIAHFWFVTIHPFEDGNGRIARAIADMALARSEQSSQRFYSMSAQISYERKSYYGILEATQKRSDLDLTNWLEWYLSCLDRALQRAESIFADVLKKSKFWEYHSGEPLNDRQRKVLNKLLDGFDGHLTSSKWATLTKCSQDTATRDIQDLIKRKILKQNQGGGRNTNYSLVDIK